MDRRNRSNTWMVMGGLDGRQVKFGPGPHEAIVIDLASIGIVEVECRE